MKKKHQYLLKIKYLGFRYHGWAKQPSHKTIQGEIEKNIRYVLDHDQFSTLGASRTDSMVSAEMNAFSLFTDDILSNDFITELNKALPQEIQALEIQEAPTNFNIISHSKSKSYHYNFSTSKNFNPLESHLCTSIKENLNIEVMIEGAHLFKGEHSFHNFCYKPKENTTFIRTISEISLVTKNDFNHTLIVTGTGFLRHQIRIIVGTLFNLGQGKITLNQIKEALAANSIKTEIGFIAPASGLILKTIVFKEL